MEDRADETLAREAQLGAQEAQLSAKLRALFRHLGGEAREPTAARGGAPGTTLGDFRVLREIGAGGMATVYEAEQRSLRRRVALKVLAPHLSLARRSVEKFRREAEAGGRLEHPGIVAIHAVGEQDGVHYIAEELVEGGRTLADQLAERRASEALPPGWFRLVADQLAQVAEALAHAHACGVIHRDVKPSNILLAPGGRPKVGDFGLARIQDSLSLSRSGVLAGTPFYMSPEQAFGKRADVDQRTDVYSLGVTLYECLTRRRPFTGESTDEVLAAILLHDPPEPRKLDPRVPKDLATVCMKAMEKDPRRRYATMNELAEDLRRFHAGEAVRAEPVGRLGRATRWVSRRKLQVGAAVVTLLAVAALVGQGALIAAQRAERRRAVQERYVPLRDALWRGRPGFVTAADKWHARVAPESPDGPLLAALSSLASGDVEQAAEDLVRCLELCARGGEATLALDAHYLLAQVDLELARTAPPERAAALRAEASRELDLAGAFDPLASTALVWREDEPRPSLRGLRLDVEHRLVRLYLGVTGFDELYKGGDPAAFRETIAHLRAALAQRPDDALVTGLLARTLLFLARTYDLHEVLPEAVVLCQRAIELSTARPFYLWSTTLGQVRLLYGDDAAALEAFAAAERQAPPASCDGHNVWLGFGRAYAHLGRGAEAQASLQRALDACRGDAHALLTLAELSFEADPQRALDCARWAWRRPGETVKGARSSTDMAAAALAVARLELARGDLAAAQRWLRELADQAIPSPRDFGQACRLALTLPAEGLSDAPELDLELTLSMLVQYLEWMADPLDAGPSAITWSGLGAARLRQGQFSDAVDALERARQARRRWPVAAREAGWADEACDLFALALARLALARLDPTQAAAQEPLARACFDAAELLVRSHERPWEQADVLDRVQVLAKRALRES